MNTERIRLLLSEASFRLNKGAKDIFAFTKQCLGDKKIVIISESGIINIPLSFKFQATMSVFTITLLLWISYSTDKYFSYDRVLSKKDREIWTTHVNNENLQYQVADLHNNLAELNKYFDNIRKYDQLAEKKIFNENNEKINISNSKTEHKTPTDEVNGIISNIRDKVLERISSLESIIEMTGLKVEQVASKNNNRLTTSEFESEGEAAQHQGGAYLPANDTEFQKEIDYLMQLEKLIHSFPLAVPIDKYWISSGYGKRIDPMRKRVAMHGGVDLVGKFKADIHASAPGVAKRAGMGGAYGRMVEIDHGAGISTLYGHMSKVLVKRGQKIERGDIIGIQGSTGRSTGNHLHYEVRYNGRTLDPSNFLKAGKYVF